MKSLFIQEDKRRDRRRLTPVGYITGALLVIFLVGVVYAAYAVWGEWRTGGLTPLGVPGSSQSPPPISTPVAREATPTPAAVKATATPTVTPAAYPTAVVTANRLHVREGPDLDFEILDTVKKDDELVAWERCGVWLHVRTPNGTTGWVHGDYVEIASGALAKLPEVESGKQ